MGYTIRWCPPDSFIIGDEEYGDDLVRVIYLTSIQNQLNIDELELLAIKIKQAVLNSIADKK